MSEPKNQLVPLWSARDKITLTHRLVSKYLQENPRKEGILINDITATSRQLSARLILTMMDKEPSIVEVGESTHINATRIKWTGYAPYLLISGFKDYAKKNNLYRGLYLEHCDTNAAAVTGRLLHSYTIEYLASDQIYTLKELLTEQYRTFQTQPYKLKAVINGLHQYAQHVLETSENKWWIL